MWECTQPAKGLFIREAGQDVCRDRTMNGIPACINFYYIYHQMFILTRDVPSWESGIPVCATGIPPQPGRFLPCKHLLPGWDERWDEFGVLKYMTWLKRTVKHRLKKLKCCYRRSRSSRRLLLLLQQPFVYNSTVIYH